MGVFFSHDKRDFTTVASTSYSIEDIFPRYAEHISDDAEVVFALKEYERYERILLFRETTQRRQIHVSVERDGVVTSRAVIAEYKSTHDKECGPGHSWYFQVDACVGGVRQQLEETYGEVGDFKEAVSDVVNND